MSGIRFISASTGAGSRVGIGLSSVVGPTGPTGPSGNVGLQGLQGNQGLIGLQGAQGLRGLNLCSDFSILNTSIRRLQEPVLICSCIKCEGINQSDVWTFWSFNWTYTAIMC